jgi:hypothetical protein
MDIELAPARAPKVRKRSAVVPALLGGIALAYVIVGVALYAIVSLAI